MFTYRKYAQYTIHSHFIWSTVAVAWEMMKWKCLCLCVLSLVRAKQEFIACIAHSRHECVSWCVSSVYCIAYRLLGINIVEWKMYNRIVIYVCANCEATKHGIVIAIVYAHFFIELCNCACVWEPVTLYVQLTNVQQQLELFCSHTQADGKEKPRKPMTTMNRSDICIDC